MVLFGSTLELAEAIYKPDGENAAVEFAEHQHWLAPKVRTLGKFAVHKKIVSINMRR